MMERTCTVCSKKISLDNNPLGLVFNDKLFVCEDCVDKHSTEELTKLTHSSMQSRDNGMPIAIWLIHEQNKDKELMSLRE